MHVHSHMHTCTHAQMHITGHLKENAPIEELDLSAWICKRVKVSFAAVSFGLGVSEFSPAATLELSGK